jgi:hypothetical protein
MIIRKKEKKKENMVHVHDCFTLRRLPMEKPLSRPLLGDNGLVGAVAGSGFCFVRTDCFLAAFMMSL